MPRLTALALASTLLLAACGDDEPDARSPEPATARPATPDTTPAARPSATGSGADRGDAAGSEIAEERPADAGDAAARAAARGRAGSAAGAAPARESGAVAPGGSAPSSLYTVQVGAFHDLETARLWERRLARQGMPVWVAMVELGGETFYRLRVGAVPTVEDARRLGALIGDRYEWPVWIAPVTPADGVPPDAAETTRRLLGD